MQSQSICGVSRIIKAIHFMHVSNKALVAEYSLSEPDNTRKAQH